MSRVLKALALLAMLVAAVSAQSCISVAGQLLNTCDRELTILKLVYPLTSDAPPNSDQEAAIKAGAPYATPSLPTAECCAAAKSALDTNCQCDSNLPALASTLGIESSEAGLQGAIHLCAQICDLGTVSC